MKVLVVTGYFPPYFVIGAQRIRKFTAYLQSRGHEVRVLTAGGYNFPKTLESPLPADAVTELNFVDVNAPINFMRNLLQRKKGQASYGGDVDATVNTEGFVYKAAGLWREIFNIPDGHICWVPKAIQSGSGLLENWKPDVVFASALPFSAAIVAKKLAMQANCPWVAEFRDLWVGNPYISRTWFRRTLDPYIERLTLSNASAFTTVSPPLARDLESRYHIPVTVVTNGFDPSEYPEDGGSGSLDKDKLTIFHGGTIYHGKRDPRPLLQAIKLLGRDGAKVEVSFAGQDLRGVMATARDLGVDESVKILPFMDRQSTLETISNTDISLLLLWNDQREEGVFSGKIFEYLGARRPILMLGYEQGVAADLIRSLRAGHVANSSTGIAKILKAWIDRKSECGEIPAFDHPERMKYALEGQFALQEDVLKAAVDKSKGA